MKSERIGFCGAVSILCAVLLTACNFGTKPNTSTTSTTLPGPSVVTEPSETEPVTTHPESTTKANGVTSAVRTVATTAKTTTAPTERKTVRVTVTEGKTLTEIFKLLDAKGVCKFNSLMQTAQSYDYSYYPLVAARPGTNRAFKLEGYLYPDTYDFYSDDKPEDVIGKMLRNGERHITADDRAAAARLGMSMDQVLTIASLIQLEGSNPSQVTKVSAVIHNRLKAGMKLQLDAPIVYIENHVKPYLTGDVNRYNTSYNTYKCSALPAGPIGNPGHATIYAALHPAQVDYLFFCHDKSAHYYYATTYEEHKANLTKAGISTK